MSADKRDGGRVIVSQGETSGAIRVGIGGWTFEPWRGVFFPPGHPHARELEFASRQVTAIEVNGTYYSGFKPATFAKWRDATPDDFVFTLKASRFCTNRKILAQAGPSIERFVGQGIVELADKLGPILWQFMATKRFDRDDFAAFLDLLPDAIEGRRLRHAVEVRHPSFLDPGFVDLARARGVAVVFAEGNDRPQIGDLTAGFAYARLQGARAEVDTGYSADELDGFARTARAWARGEDPAEVAHVQAPREPAAARDVFVFMISGAKVRAPAAAQALLQRLSTPTLG